MHDQMYTKYLMKTDMVNITDPYVINDIDDTYKGQSIIPIIPVFATANEGRVL